MYDRGYNNLQKPVINLDYSNTISGERIKSYLPSIWVGIFIALIAFTFFLMWTYPKRAHIDPTPAEMRMQTNTDYSNLQKSVQGKLIQ